MLERRGTVRGALEGGGGVLEGEGGVLEGGIEYLRLISCIALDRDKLDTWELAPEFVRCVRRIADVSHNNRRRCLPFADNAQLFSKIAILGDPRLNFSILCVEYVSRHLTDAYDW